MKIGILTSGGDCPGLNAVIRAAVLHGIKSYDHEFVGFRDGFRQQMPIRTAEGRKIRTAFIAGDAGLITAAVPQAMVSEMVPSCAPVRHSSTVILRSSVA